MSKSVHWLLKWTGLLYLVTLGLLVEGRAAGEMTSSQRKNFCFCSVKSAEPSSVEKRWQKLANRWNRRKRETPGKTTITKYKWTKKHLTYRVSEYPTQENISRQHIDAELARAFQLWEEQADLRFLKSSDFDVDIELKFASGSHGDSTPFFDQTLAHAFLPPTGPADAELGGDVHFNDDYGGWMDGTTFLHTATHEIGHALGLVHSWLPGAVMSPYQGNAQLGVHLDAEDIERIQALYGPPLPVVTTTTTQRSLKPRTRAPTSRTPGSEEDQEMVTVATEDDAQDDVLQDSGQGQAGTAVIGKGLVTTESHLDPTTETPTTQRWSTRTMSTEKAPVTVTIGTQSREDSENEVLEPPDHTGVIDSDPIITKETYTEPITEVSWPYPSTTPEEPTGVTIQTHVPAEVQEAADPHHNKDVRDQNQTLHTWSESDSDDSGEDDNREGITEMSSINRTESEEPEGGSSSESLDSKEDDGDGFILDDPNHHIFNKSCSFSSSGSNSPLSLAYFLSLALVSLFRGR